MKKNISYINVHQSYKSYPFISTRVNNSKTQVQMCHSLFCFLKKGHKIKSFIMIFEFNSIFLILNAFVPSYPSKIQLCFTLCVTVLFKSYLCSRPQGFSSEENNAFTHVIYNLVKDMKNKEVYDIKWWKSHREKDSSENTVGLYALPTYKWSPTWLTCNPTCMSLIYLHLNLLTIGRHHTKNILKCAIIKVGYIRNTHL